MSKILSQRSFATGFFAIVAVLPLLLIEGWGNSYSEPKFIALFGLTIFSAICCYPKLIKHQTSIPTRIWSFGMVALIALQLVSLQQPFNQGLAWQTVGLTMALIVIPLAVQNSTFDIGAFCISLLFPIAILLIGALAMILFRVVLFSEYSPFGSAIGLKNSLSIFLAQTIPFLLLLSSNKSARHKRWLRNAAYLLLALCFWVIFASRTRSAWWMVGFYLGALIIFHQINRDTFRSMLQNAVTSAAVGLGLLLLIPNTLVWRSSTPYWSSLSSMLSIEQASGRKELWQIALEIIYRHPQGIGVGQYPALWKGYIQYTAIDPKFFSFLREDLPLFNDYLQIAAESGIVASLIFSLLCFALPFAILALCIYKKNLSLTVITPLLVCCATALDACFDYPFNRPETIMLYAISVGFILRQYLPEKTKIRGLSGQLIFSSGLLLIVVALSIVATKMYLGLSARKYWQSTGSLTSLETGLRHWPWDIQWRYRPLEALLKKKDVAAASAYARVRMVAWPNDPFSHLLHAKLYEQQKDFETALIHYQQAIVLVKNGNCFRPGFEHYKKLQKHLPQGISTIDTTICK